MPHRRISEIIGKRPFPTVSPDTTARSAAIIMKEWHSSAVVVVVEDRLAGIFTERDLAFRVVALGSDPAKTPVSTVMTSKVKAITPDKPFGHALHLMYEGGFRHMPVVDRSGRPVGLIAAQDALAMDSLQLSEDLVRREEISVIL